MTANADILQDEIQVSGIIHCSGGGLTKSINFGEGITYVQDGVCKVGPGKYEIIYETSQLLRKVFSTNTPIGELMDSPAALAALTAAAPRFTEIPEQYKKASIRQLAAAIPGSIPEEALDQFDQLFAGIE